MGAYTDFGPWAGDGHLLVPSSLFFPSCKGGKPIFVPEGQGMEAHGSVGVTLAAGGDTPRAQSSACSPT